MSDDDAIIAAHQAIEELCEAVEILADLLAGSVPWNERKPVLDAARRALRLLNEDKQ